VNQKLEIVVLVIELDTSSLNVTFFFFHNKFFGIESISPESQKTVAFFVELFVSPLYNLVFSFGMKMIPSFIHLSFFRKYVQILDNNCLGLEDIC
jgi:hypothetical protein